MTDVWFFAVVVAVALLASFLTLFSGFGLGTLLLPAFAWVFPIEVAIAATAIVHIANNLWKGGMFWRGWDSGVVLRFGVPAMLAAFAGAALLDRLEGRTVAVLVGTLIIAFGLFDLVPRLRAWSVGPRHLPVGGLLSGFFGGLSGHQGALRSVFLTKLGLDARTFVATGVACAVLVDAARLTIYGPTQLSKMDPEAAGLVAAACVAAFAGAVLGKRLLGKTTMDTLRTIVGALVVTTGALIVAGVV